MKRSEMKDKIRKLLINELQYEYVIGLDELVLKEIEEAGMQPPKSDNPYIYGDGEWEKE